MSEAEHSGRVGGGRLAHSRVPMSGRDPQEKGRVASPLELLFDLTFLTAVGTAAHYLAEVMAAGHLGPAVVSFVLAMFAIFVAWTNFSWFASAFDTDDWLFRTLTMLQMIGVVVFALGLPAMFHSVEEGHHLELRAMVIGYVVMRIAMILQWWRAARESPEFRDVGMASIRWTVTAQAAWIALGFVVLPLSLVLIGFALFGLFEMLLPMLSRVSAEGTPWHPHHVAERYGLFAMIALGEGVVGTVASSADLLGDSGTHWTWDAVAVVMAGVGLTFGMWWVYFITPFAIVLARRRKRAYLFSHGHIPVFIGIAGAGAALHLAGLYLEHQTEIGSTTVVTALSVPVGAYLLSVYLLHTLLLSAMDKFHLLLIALTLIVLLAAVLLSVAGAPISVSLLVTMLAPFVTVIGYETIGFKHQQKMLGALVARDE